MYNLDLPSIMLLFVCNGFLLSFLSFWLWLENRENFPETKWWFFAVLLMSFGVFFSILRVMIRPDIAIIAGNTLFVSGFFSLYFGLAHFKKIRALVIPNFVLLVITFFLFYYYTVFEQNVLARIIVLSGSISILILECCCAIVRTGVHLQIKHNKVFILIFGSVFLNNMLRIGYNIVYPPGNDFLYAKNNDKVFLIITQIQLILVAIVLFQLINVRLRFALRNTVEKKEILVKEVYHRVKNNLNIIQSLLSLQAMDMTDQTARIKLQASETRVRSMAMIHESLYQTDDLKEINIEDYIYNLTEYLFSTYNTHVVQIKLKLDVDDIRFDIDVIIPLGLIINELVTNALKYAFEGRSEGILFVSLKKQQNNGYVLCIKDNGNGLPDNFSLTSKKSLGMEIVESFTKQLQGTFEYRSDHGTEFRITFSNISQ